MPIICSKLFLHLVVFLSMLAVQSAYGQQPEVNKFTLEQCLALATTNNIDIKNAKLGISHTKHQTQVYLSQLFPKISANVDYRYNLQIPVTLIPSSAFGGPEGQYNEVAFGVAQSTTAGFSLEQGLYNHVAFIGLKAIKPMKEQSRLTYEETKATILYNVAAAFYNIQIAEVQKQLIAKNLESLSKTIANIEALVDQELMPKTELAKLNIQYAKLTTQVKSIVVNIDKMYNMLKLLMGMSAKDNLTILQKGEAEMTDFFIPTAQTPSVDNLRQTRIQHIQVDLLKVNKALALAPFIPSLVMRAGYSIAGNNNEFNPFRTILDKWFPSSYVSLGIRIPILSGFVEGLPTRRLKNIEIEQAQNKLKYFKLDLERQIADTYNEYQSKKEIQISRKQIFESQNQILQSEIVNYELGISNLTDLLRAQDDLSSASNDYIKSLVELKKSELNYKRLINVNFQ